MKTYKIYSLDVWGSNKIGYEVNDLSFSGLTIELSNDFTDRELIKSMKEVGYLNNKLHFKSLVIDGEKQTLWIGYMTSKIFNRPIAELRLVERETVVNDSLVPFFVNV
jgi:hypothetical protein